MSPSCDSTAPLSFTCDGYNLKSTCEALVDFYESTVGCSWTSGYDGYVARRGLEEVVIDPEDVGVLLAATGTQAWVQRNFTRQTTKEFRVFRGL